MVLILGKKKESQPASENALLVHCRCIVVDHGGFVILSDDYISTNEFISAKHIADVEPQVTSVLMAHNVLRRMNCSNVKTGKLQRMYGVRRN